MKIWFPTINTNSGSDMFVRRLSSALDNKGINTVITWFPHWRELLPYFVNKPSPPINTDIIHVNSWHGFSFYHKNIPLVTTCHHCVHDSAYKTNSSLMQKIYHTSLIYKFERETFLKSSAVNTVSDYSTKIVTDKFIDISPITIPNGINTDYFKPASNGIKATLNRKFRIFYAGNLSQRKGADLIPGIMNQLDDNVELRYSSGLSKKNINLGRNCIRLGFLTDKELLEEYQQCDAVLYPSRYEGFGYVACEAMACGKPVIASRCSALTELIVDGVTGFLCNPDDTLSFAMAIQKLASSRQLCLNLGRAGRERIKRHYTEQKMAEEYIRLYSDILNKHN